MQKLRISILMFAIITATWMVSYTYNKPETLIKLNVKIEKLEAQNAILRKLINIQNKELEKCGSVHSIRYVKN